MKRRPHAQTLESVDGNCRERRRPEGRRRAGWVRPFWRLQHALDSTHHLVGRSMLNCGLERVVRGRPVGASQELGKAEELLCRASTSIWKAGRELEKMFESIVRHPEDADGAPELFIAAIERLIYLTESVARNANSIFELHQAVLDGLRDGTLVPERAAICGRIELVQRPALIRAFLLVRQPRVVDRIAPLLRRRRRTPRPASLRVPQRRVLGRAPPLSVSLL